MRSCQGRPMIALGILSLVVSAAGCAVVHQMIIGDGPMLPAQYEGLAGKRVAVVCMIDSSSSGMESTAQQIASRVGSLIAANVDEVKVVRPEEVADWVDTNNWDEMDFVEVGKGLKVDRVIGIEVLQMSLHEGQTLYKGKATVSTRVYNVNNGGEILFDFDKDLVVFPENHGIPATDRPESEFRRLYLVQLATHLARYFYPHPLAESFAKDAAAYAH